MIMGIQFLTLNCVASVFSFKSSLEKLLTISWVMKAYIKLIQVWDRRTLKISRQWVLRVTCDLAWDFLEHMAFHGLALASQSRATHEIFSFIDFHQTLTHNPSIKSYKKYREMIEQKYNQIWLEIKANIKT